MPLVDDEIQADQPTALSSQSVLFFLAAALLLFRRFSGCLVTSSFLRRLLLSTARLTALGWRRAEEEGILECVCEELSCG
jgi:hypothetical protein